MTYCKPCTRTFVRDVPDRSILTWPFAPTAQIVAGAVAVWLSLPRWHTPSRIVWAGWILDALAFVLFILRPSPVALALIWVSRDLRNLSAPAPPPSEGEATTLGEAVACLECGATIARDAVRCKACGWSFVPDPTPATSGTAPALATAPSPWTLFFLWCAVAVSGLEWATSANETARIVRLPLGPAVQLMAAILAFCLALWFQVPGRHADLRRATMLVGALAIAAIFIESIAALPLLLVCNDLWSSWKPTPAKTKPSLATDPVG